MLDLDAIKNVLEKKLKELQDRAANIDDSLSAPKNSDSEERAVESEDDQTITAIGELTDAEMRDIKIAIHRIESGVYTVCEICGKPISKERLLALPWTSKCVRCA